MSGAQMNPSASVFKLIDSLPHAFSPAPPPFDHQCPPHVCAQRVAVAFSMGWSGAGDGVLRSHRSLGI